MNSSTITHTVPANPLIAPSTAAPPYANLASMLVWVLLPAYVLLCARLRFRRRDAMLAKYGFATRESLASMTSVQAQEIQRYLMELEFPKIFFSSLQFALFKTYGIPTISSLLASTREFSTPANASKRYHDTTVLITEFTSHHPKDPRVLQAISRMNYIHSHYEKSGKISNDDLLYTLSVFITGPVDWVKMYEWREMNLMEICAIATHWRVIGDAMSISYHELKRNGNWKDGIEFYEDIAEWALSYEQRAMVPAASNKKSADELIPLLLFYVPAWAVSSARDVIGVFMPPILRAAMMFPTPAPLTTVLTHALLAARRYFIFFLLPPRPAFLASRYVPDRANAKTGKFNSPLYLAHPYYVKPTWVSRWGPEALLTWVIGGVVPGSEQYCPGGYDIRNLGPDRYKGKGEAQMDGEEQRLRETTTTGCPFGFAK